jgi:hypothetical protein
LQEQRRWGLPGLCRGGALHGAALGSATPRPHPAPIHPPLRRPPPPTAPRPLGAPPGAAAGGRERRQAPAHTAEKRQRPQGRAPAPARQLARAPFHLRPGCRAARAAPDSPAHLCFDCWPGGAAAAPEETHPGGPLRCISNPAPRVVARQHHHTCVPQTHPTRPPHRGPRPLPRPAMARAAGSRRRTAGPRRASFRTLTAMHPRRPPLFPARFPGRRAISFRPARVPSGRAPPGPALLCWPALEGSASPCMPNAPFSMQPPECNLRVYIPVSPLRVAPRAPVAAAQQAHEQQLQRPLREGRRWQPSRRNSEQRRRRRRQQRRGALHITPRMTRPEDPSAFAALPCSA